MIEVFPFFTGEGGLLPFAAVARVGEEELVLNEEGEVLLDEEVLMNSIDESESCSSESENSAEVSVEDDSSIRTGGGFFRGVVDCADGLGGDGE